MKVDVILTVEIGEYMLPIKFRGEVPFEHIGGFPNLPVKAIHGMEIHEVMEDDEDGSGT